MIGYIRGTVEQILPDACYIDVQGVGYRVFVPASTRDKLTGGLVMKLYTYLNVREDAMYLFGFATQEEHSMFLLLLNVNGVGPKMAMAILSGMKPEGIRTAISRNDLAALTRISGVGKKTAERIILELKDKIGQVGLDPAAQPDAVLQGGEATAGFDEALAALIALGYQQGEILPRLRKLSGEEMSTKELIRAVLREMGGR